MKEINAVLFDLDGTLVDSNQLLINAFAHTLHHFFPHLDFSQDDYIQMIGPSLHETFSLYQQDEEMIKNMIAFFRSFYRLHEKNSIEIYPHVIQTLKELKELKFQTGIVTTKLKESALPSIHLFNLDNYLDIYVFLDNVKNPKPHPEPVYYALDLLKSPKQVLIVGDNPSDIHSGKNAKILTCGVNWSYKKEELLKSQPDFWINDFSELLPIIIKYNKEVLK